jgi:hypothetical protein
VLKLYKTVRGRVRYWEAWQHKTKLVVHTGLLGHWGRQDRMPMDRGESEKAAIKRYAKAPRADGYAPIPAHAHKMLVVQYRVDGWGSVEDLDARDAVEHILNESLGWTGNGHCDGGDIGSGTINLFCLVVDPALAVKAIVLALKKAKRLEGAVIAVSPSADVEPKMRVRWPTGHRGRFSTDPGS